MREYEKKGDAVYWRGGGGLLHRAYWKPAIVKAEQTLAQDRDEQ
jgi:hypothetical protein